MRCRQLVFAMLFCSTVKGQCTAFWSVASVSGPSPRYDPAVAFDSARGVGVLFGGQDSVAGIVADTWEWNGTAWSQRTTLPAPHARTEHRMVFDSFRGVALLYGGRSPLPLGDTWTWNGTAWTLVADTDGPAPNGPPPRQAFGMAYDADRHVTVLYGGELRTGQVAGDTWEWNGTAWNQVMTASDPPPLEGNVQMAYDLARHRMVLYGGWSPITGDSQSTWEYDGQTWTLLQLSGPLPNTLHPRMVYDGGRGRLLLTGMRGVFGEGVRVYEWSGGAWSLVCARGPYGGSGNREGASLFFDSARDEVVSFGGADTFNSWPTESWRLRAVSADLGVAATSPFACPGATVLLSVATNAGTYQGAEQFSWRRNGQPVTPPNGTGTAATLRLENVGHSTSGVYDCLVANYCGAVTTRSFRLYVAPADVGSQGGIAGADGFYDNNDFVAFISAFFSMSPEADVGAQGGAEGGDGAFDNNDFVVFINQFFSGC